MDNGSHIPTIAEVMANPQKHGRLISCEWNAHSSGMMFNSDSSQSRKLESSGGEITYTTFVKPPFDAAVTSVYRINGGGAFVKLEKLIERENLTAWSELRYVKTVEIMDYSSGEGITVVYDDTSVGGAPQCRSYINAEAARQQGGDAVIKELLAIFDEAAADASLISQTSAPRKQSPLERAMGPGFMGMRMPDSVDAPHNVPFSEPQRKYPQSTPQSGTSNDIPSEGEWICPECKTAGNRGKFCPECGAARQN